MTCSSRSSSPPSVYFIQTLGVDGASEDDTKASSDVALSQPGSDVEASLEVMRGHCSWWQLTEDIKGLPGEAPGQSGSFAE